MMTDTGMWRPNWTFCTLEQSFHRLRLKAKWYAFQCRRRGDSAGDGFWTRNAAAHAAAIAQMLQTLTPAIAGHPSGDAAGDLTPSNRAVAGTYQESA